MSLVTPSVLQESDMTNNLLIWRGPAKALATSATARNKSWKCMLIGRNNMVNWKCSLLLDSAVRRCDLKAPAISWFTNVSDLFLGWLLELKGTRAGAL